MDVVMAGMSADQIKELLKGLDPETLKSIKDSATAELKQTDKQKAEADAAKLNGLLAPFDTQIVDAIRAAVESFTLPDGIKVLPAFNFHFAPADGDTAAEYEIKRGSVKSPSGTRHTGDDYTVASISPKAEKKYGDKVKVGVTYNGEELCKTLGIEIHPVYTDGNEHKGQSGVRYVLRTAGIKE